MIADFHKDFLGHTVVLPDRTGEGWFGRMVKSSKSKVNKSPKWKIPILRNTLTFIQPIKSKLVTY
ncbi:MAG: hypothetical protein HC803_00985 [Saprospiraceae bacterium]|nr:hypothetical protein [Saprospiraceae bacterium]